MILNEDTKTNEKKNQLMYIDDFKSPQFRSEE